MNATEAMSADYEAAAEELKRRILALIPSHPEILEMHDPFALFRIDEFKCADLNPSMAQVDWALGAAQQEHRQPGGST